MLILFSLLLANTGIVNAQIDSVGVVHESKKFTPDYREGFPRVVLDMAGTRSADYNVANMIEADYTLDFWLKPELMEGERYTIFAAGVEKANYESLKVTFRPNGTGKWILELYDGSGGNATIDYYIDDESEFKEVWNHFMITYNDGSKTMRLYVNGKQKVYGTFRRDFFGFTTSGTNTYGRLTVGLDWLINSDSYKGSLSNFRIWQKKHRAFYSYTRE